MTKVLCKEFVMIYTSYFANHRVIKEIGLEIVSISRFAPAWMKGIREVKQLAPSKELLNDYKASPDEIDYAKRYVEEVSVASTLDVKNNEVLCCYEKASDFCHRGILRSLLAKNDILSMELKKSYSMFVVVDYRYKELDLSRNLSALLVEFSRMPVLLSSKEDISHIADGCANVTYEPFTNNSDADVIVYFTTDCEFNSEIKEQVERGSYVIRFANDDRTLIYDYMATRTDS